MEALKRVSLALSVLAFGGVGCGDDDGGSDKPSGTLDASLDAKAPTDSSTKPGFDAAGFECRSNTPPTATMCGGSHCLQTFDQLKANISSTAVCKTDLELQQFCQLSSVVKVQNCIVAAVTNGATDFAGATKTCAQPQLPDYSEACLDCFVASAVCAAQHCAGVCTLNPGAAACDECRVNYGCISDFYKCTGIKNPIPGL
jgi:hypothetical protein